LLIQWKRGEGQKERVIVRVGSPRLKNQAKEQLNKADLKHNMEGGGGGGGGGAAAAAAAAQDNLKKLKYIKLVLS
jgi:hypothetical protein